MIKILIFALSIIAMTLFGQSQYATTSSGQKVILKSDGTWEYVKSNSSSINKLSSGTGHSNFKEKSSKNRKNSSARSYIRGPRGGCYYINGNGGKTYVDRSMCD
jgi:hypothetical protein